MKPKILLLGSGGQVGSDLLTFLPDIGELTAFDRSHLDLTDFATLRQRIQSSRPAIIVNAAAYTAVDRAESEPQLVEAVNAEAVAVIGEEARNLDALVIHYSTDYVFDGNKAGPYIEADAANPINVYGRTKLAGEHALQVSGARHLIFRTSWVYATRGHNFLLTILRLATTREELRVVDDQIGAPTWSRAIAKATTEIISQLNADAELENKWRKISGIYHMSAAGQTTWCEFARAILWECAHLQPPPSWLSRATGGKEFVVKRVVAIKTSEYPTPARRPANSVLSDDKLLRSFRIRPPDWHAQLVLALQDSRDFLLETPWSKLNGNPS